MASESIDFSLSIGELVSTAIRELPPNPCFGAIVDASIHDLPPIEAGGLSHGQLVAGTLHELPPNPCFGQIVSEETFGIVHGIGVTDTLLI